MRSTTPKYTLVESDAHEQYGIEINTPPYEGVVFSFNRVRFWENTGETATVKFDYTIHKHPGKFSADKAFENFIGDILVELLDNNE